MALFLSDRFTSATGSIGGTTFSHNRFGMYVRARRTPVNPNTSYQQAQRNAMAAVSAEWRALTDAQRAAWNAYAAGTPHVNRLGQACVLTGSQQYVAVSSLFNRFGVASIPAAPATNGKLALGTPTVVLHSATSIGNITGLTLDDDVDIGLFLGNAQSAGIAFFAGPYQLRGFGAVASGAAAVTGLAGRNGVPLATGQRIPWRLAGANKNGSVAGNVGKLTTVASGFVTVVA